MLMAKALAQTTSLQTRQGLLDEDGQFNAFGERDPGAAETGSREPGQNAGT